LVVPEYVSINTIEFPLKNSEIRGPKKLDNSPKQKELPSPGSNLVSEKQTRKTSRRNSHD
jgi:hypothetical protein